MLRQLLLHRVTLYACLALMWMPGGALCGAAGAPGTAGGGIIVFAAASLTDAVEEADAAFSARTGVPVKASFAASSILAKQIEAGAPADVYFAADRQWMDYLDARGLIRRGSRRELLGNELVLIAPAGTPLRLKIAPGFDLRRALGQGRLATGDPDSVPVGEYARAALMKLGAWERVSDRLVRAENVRAALAYVARAEAPLGIVYLTDAQAEKRVRIVDTFPADSHPPITYPLALTSGARTQAESYVEFLAGDMARQIFVRRGFVLLNAPESARTR